MSDRAQSLHGADSPRLCNVFAVKIFFPPPKLSLTLTHSLFSPQPLNKLRTNPFGDKNKRGFLTSFWKKNQVLSVIVSFEVDVPKSRDGGFMWEFLLYQLHIKE